MKAAASEEPRSRLGRGLAALIGDSGHEAEAVTRIRGQKRVPIEFLRPNPRNPRTMFEEADLVELTDSIRQKGIIQPILVRSVPGEADAWEIIAGERRWRAAQRAELHDVPIVTIEADDKQALEIAIIENVQRANLNVMEEAQGYERLASEYGYTQQDLARTIGKSRSHVTNTLRLLKLPAATRTLVTDGAITAGHARALILADDPVALGQRIVSRNLSVRAVEDLVKRETEAKASAGEAVPDRGGRPRGRDKDPDTIALEKRLGDKVGLVVDIAHRGESGEIRMRYTSLEQLDRIVELLSA